VRATVTSQCKVAAAIGLFGSVLLVSTLPARAQQPSGAKPAPSLTQQQREGENLFLQNCSLCHMPHKEGNPKTSEEGTSYGPSFKGLFKGPKPVLNDQIARQFITKGTQKMPGFQYSLEPKEIDNIIAYLKTL
jgi:mono/diheme cytochrome c family protein